MVSSLRRSATRAGCIAALTGSLAFPATATPGTDLTELGFRVFGGGAPIGSHTIAFSRDGDEMTVRVAIDLEVKFAFLTVYEYSHRNVETWRDGRLIAMETVTDDNGTAYEVRAVSTADGLKVEGSGGTFTAPADVLPSSYWHPATTGASQLLDTQRGKLVDVAIAAGGATSVDVGGKTVDARTYDVTGDLQLQLRYARDDTWLGTRFTYRGYEIDYQAQPTGDLLALADRS